MIPVCLKIGEDELFSTWLAAVAEANHMLPSEFGQVYLGYQTKQRWAAQVYMRNIEDFCDRHKDMAFFPDLFEILRRHMPYGVMQIGMSRQVAARQAEIILRESTAEGGMYKKPIRYCPICSQEDLQQYGRRIAHVPHQLREIKVCWKHGCVLDGEVVPNNHLEAQLRVARYARELYRLQLDARMEQAWQLLDTYQREHQIKGIYQLINLVGEAGYIDSVRVCESQIETRHLYMVNCIFALMAFVHPDPSDLCALLGKLDHVPVDTEDAHLLEARAGLGKYQCKACGHVFYAHEKAIEAGLLCPACRNGLDDQAYKERLLHRFHNGEYEWADYNHIRHKPCGTTKQAGLLFWLRDKECGGCKAYTLQDWQGLWKDTEYEVKDIVSTPDGRQLSIIHKTCGCEFLLPVPTRWLYGKIMDVAFCPHCEKKVQRITDVRRRNERVGQYAMASTGIGMTVIQYKSYFAVLVRFDNGLERWTTWQIFKNIQDKKIQQYQYQEFYIGAEKVMKDGQHCVIVDYQNNRHLRVRFDDGAEVEGSYRAFRHGSLVHP